MKKKVIGILICMGLVLTVLPVSGVINYNNLYYRQILAGGDLPSLTNSKNMLGPLGRANLPPYQPTNESPANGSIDVYFDMDLSWTGGDPDGDPVTYDVYFGTNSSSLPMVSNNQSATIYDPGTMNYNTTYYWKIIAWDNQSAFNESLLWEFTTEEEQNHPPYQPSNPDPANGSTGVRLDVYLNWTGGDPDGDPVTYDVYFGTNSSSLPMVSNNQSATVYDPGILNSNTTHYWKIIAWDNQSAFNESPLWEFTTGINQPPYQPTNESPAHNSTGVDINVDLSWEGGDPDPGDIVTYDVYFGTNSSSLPMVSNNQSATIYDPGTLNTSTPYYWQIVAWDNIGLFTEGPIWKFTTAGNIPPYPPIIISGPSFGGPGINHTFSAIASDPEGDDVYYMWDWGDGNFSDWIGPFDITTPVETNYSWNNSGEYEIKVRAKDVHNATGDWSETHNISISKQIEINNLKPGFIYFYLFTFTKSYLYLYAFDVLGIAAVLSTSSGLYVNATVTDAVDSVRFEAFQILWNMSTEEWDDDMSDGADAYIILPFGLFRVTAYAYDADGNMIDKDTIDYLFLLCKGSSGGGKLGRVRQALANRLLK